MVNWCLHGKLSFRPLKKCALGTNGILGNCRVVVGCVETAYVILMVQKLRGNYVGLIDCKNDFGVHLQP